jgi:hypothetical protein
MGLFVQTLNEPRILKRVIELYKDGSISPLNPISTFDAEAVQDAFRQVQDGNHIGKVVVRMPQDTSGLPSLPPPSQLQLKSDASYLLTGGLGGLGKVISTWLVERGARSLVFLSRSAGKTPEDHEFFRELESSGCSVTAVAGKAESMEDVEKAISHAPQRIAGVLHLAMVLRVGAFLCGLIELLLTDGVGFAHNKYDPLRLDGSK